MQDECIREVVRLQKDCGLEVVTDGEFRRISYWEKFVRLTQGLEVKDAVFTFHDAEGHESKFTAPYVSGKVARAEPITLGRAPASATTRSPCPRRRRCTSTASPTGASAYDERGRVLRRPGQGLSGGDRRSRQSRLPLRAARRGGGRHPVRSGGAREGESAGGDPDQLVDLYIDAINEAVKGQAGGHHRGRARLPRQLQGDVPLRGRLRLGGRAVLRPHPMSTISCWNSTRRAPAASRRCASCRRTRAWCSGWSARRRRCWRSWTRSSAAPRKRRRRQMPARLAISPQWGGMRKRIYLAKLVSQQARVPPPSADMELPSGTCPRQGQDSRDRRFCVGSRGTT